MKSIVVANFKMNFNKQEVDNYLCCMENNEFPLNVVFCPSYIYLNNFVSRGLIVGSQDVSCYEDGSYTGEVSAFMLDSIGVSYVIIGHSERRSNFNDDRFVSEKLRVALQNNLIPILCIGDNEGDNVNKVLIKQLDDAFMKINNVDINNVIIAYEPVYAIGTGVIPDNENIVSSVSFIKNYIYEKYDATVKVLYGGSVNISNIYKINTIDILDGYLVGNASLKPDKFIELVKMISIN